MTPNVVFLSSDWQTQWCLALPQTKSIGKFDQFMPPVDWVGKKKIKTNKQNILFAKPKGFDFYLTFKQ